MMPRLAEIRGMALRQARDHFEIRTMSL